MRTWEYIGKLPTIYKISETCLDYKDFVYQKKQEEKRRKEAEELAKEPLASAEDIRKVKDEFMKRMGIKK